MQLSQSRSSCCAFRFEFGCVPNMIGRQQKPHTQPPLKQIKTCFLRIHGAIAVLYTHDTTTASFHAFAALCTEHNSLTARLRGGQRVAPPFRNIRRSNKRTCEGGKRVSQIARRARALEIELRTRLFVCGQPSVRRRRRSLPALPRRPTHPQRSLQVVSCVVVKNAQNEHVQQTNTIENEPACNSFCSSS